MQNPTRIDVSQINNEQLRVFVLETIGAIGEDVDTLFISETVPVGVGTLNILFPEPFLIIPKVFISISNKDSTTIIAAQVYNISKEGFTVVFSGLTPNAGYVVHYLASPAEGRFSIFLT